METNRNLRALLPLVLMLVLVAFSFAQVAMQDQSAQINQPNGKIKIAPSKGFDLSQNSFAKNALSASNDTPDISINANDQRQASIGKSGFELAHVAVLNNLAGSKLHNGVLTPIFTGGELFYIDILSNFTVDYPYSGSMEDFNGTADNGATLSGVWFFNVSSQIITQPVYSTVNNPYTDVNGTLHDNFSQVQNGTTQITIDTSSWLPISQLSLKPGQSVLVKERFSRKDPTIESDVKPMFGGVLMNQLGIYSAWTGTPYVCSATTLFPETNFLYKCSVNSSNAMEFNATAGCVNIRVSDGTDPFPYFINNKNSTYCGNATNNLTIFVIGNSTSTRPNWTIHTGNTAAASGENFTALAAAWGDVWTFEKTTGFYPSLTTGLVLNASAGNEASVATSVPTCYLGGCVNTTNNVVSISDTNYTLSGAGAALSIFSVVSYDNTAYGDSGTVNHRDGGSGADWYFGHTSGNVMLLYNGTTSPGTHALGVAKSVHSEATMWGNGRTVSYINSTLDQNISGSFGAGSTKLNVGGQSNNDQLTQGLIDMVMLNKSVVNWQYMTDLWVQNSSTIAGANTTTMSSVGTGVSPIYTNSPITWNASASTSIGTFQSFNWVKQVNGVNTSSGTFICNGGFCSNLTAYGILNDSPSTYGIGDQIVLWAQANSTDNFASSSFLASSTYTVVDNTPIVTNLLIAPNATIYPNTVISGNVTAQDNDTAQTLTASFSWYRSTDGGATYVNQTALAGTLTLFNGTPNSTSLNLLSAGAAQNDRWKFGVQVNDTLNWTAPLNTSFITVLPYVFQRPTATGVLNNLSITINSATFANISSFNTSPGTSNKTFYLLTRIDVFKPAGGTADVGDFRLLMNSTQVGFIEKTLAAGFNDTVSFQSGPFTSAELANFNITLQAAKASGPGSFNVTDSKIVLLGMRDIDTGNNLTYFNFSFNNTTTSSSLIPVRNFSMTLTAGQPVITINRQLTDTTAATIFWDLNLTSNGTVYPCSLNSKRFLDTGLLGLATIGCAINQTVPAGPANLTLYMSTNSGTVTMAGIVNVFVTNGTSLQQNNQTSLSGFSTTSTSLTIIRNMTVEVANNNETLVGIAAPSFNDTVAGSNVCLQVQYVNSTGSIVHSSAISCINTILANSDYLGNVLSSTPALPSGNYTLNFYASTTGGTLNFDGGTFIVFSTDNVKNTVSPNSPTVFSPINITYFNQSGSTLLINYSNATATQGSAIQQYRITLRNPDNTTNLTILNNNSANLNYTWNYSTVAFGQYIVEVEANDTLGQIASGFSPLFIITDNTANISANSTVQQYDLLSYNNSLNFTAIRSTINTVTASYGGSTWLASCVNTTGVYFCNATIQPPFTSSSNAYNITWKIIGVGQDSNPFTTTFITPFQIIVNASGLYQCNSSVNIPAINYSFFDQNTLTSINATLTAIFQVNSSNGTVKSISYGPVTNTTQTVCIAPNSSFWAIAIENVNASGYGPVSQIEAGQYYNSSVTMRPIGMVNTSSGAFYTFTVQNQFSAPIPGATVTGFHFVTANNTWISLGSQTTDSTGSIVLFLVPASLYNFTISASGYQTLNFSFTPASTTNVLIILKLANVGQINNLDQIWNDTSYSITPTPGYYNLTQTITFTVTSNNSGLLQTGINIYQLMNGVNTLVYTNLSTNPNSVSFSYSAVPNATYTVYPWFIHAPVGNQTIGNFSVAPVTYTINTAAQGSVTNVAAMLQTGQIIGPWAYYFLVILASAGVGIFVSTRNLAAGGFTGLIILWAGTFLWPGAILFSFVTVFIASAGLTILALAVAYTTMWGG